MKSNAIRKHINGLKRNAVKLVEASPSILCVK